MQNNADEQKQPASNPEKINPEIKIDSVNKGFSRGVHDIVEVEITRITDYGAFVKFGDGKKGLIHISQVADSYVKNVNDHLKVGDKVKAKITAVSPDGKIDLTLKTPKDSMSRLREQKRSSGQNSSSRSDKPFRTSAFEERLKQFLEESEERQADIKKHVEQKQGKH